MGLIATFMAVLVGCGAEQGGRPGGGGSDRGGVGEGGSDRGGGAGGGGSDGGGAGGGGSTAGWIECFEAKPGCVVPSGTPRVENPSVPAEDLASLARNNVSFALDLGRALQSSNQNLVYSPYSISTALAMTYAGARTTTEEAMAEAMRFELPQERLHPAFNAVDLELQERARDSGGTEGGGFRLHTANAIWSQSAAMEPPFLKVLSEHYGAHVRLANFSSAEEGADLINKWVSHHTEGKIPTLLHSAPMHDTEYVLVNAIYFDAAWRTPFEERATKPGTFRRGDATSVTVPMMRGVQETRHGAGDGWEAVEIPYAGTPVSMFLVLPAEGTADAFLESLDGAALEEIIASMQERSVDITMPKFSFSSSPALEPPLSELGMGIAFGPGADFSGITGGLGIYIQAVIHKAFIGVDEAGTEAAAATAVVFGQSGAGTFREPASIVLDRPFFFFISDVPTGALLFAGRVNDPTAH
ncbi:serpin family protein [Sorangium sp. So ce513]|uniref:serpin family protein n=1 Tax=Sorangium sp. So ce513 TaxID=3133315 RepID=UPI003F5F7EDB